MLEREREKPRGQLSSCKILKNETREVVLWVGQENYYLNKKGI